MRIIGGIAKGRTATTKGLSKKKSRKLSIRPTSSKVREALFDILRDQVIGAIFLDLYAGTGVIGFEALSRGCKVTYFVEKNKKLIDVLTRNAIQFGYENKSFIIREKAGEFLMKSAKKNKLFDIIFVDPPYASDQIEFILPLIGGYEVLNGEGTVVVEHFFKKSLSLQYGTLHACKHYRYGDTMLTIFKQEC